MTTLTGADSHLSRPLTICPAFCSNQSSDVRALTRWLCRLFVRLFCQRKRGRWGAREASIVSTGNTLSSTRLPAVSYSIPSRILSTVFIISSRITPYNSSRSHHIPILVNKIAYKIASSPTPPYLPHLTCGPTSGQTFSTLSRHD